MLGREEDRLLTRAARGAIGFVLLSGLALAQDVAVTQGQAPTDWEDLFDGKTLDGWMVLPGKDADGQWVVKDGALTPEGRPGSLATAQIFGDFELAVEWKTADDGNSGIFYRVPPQAKAATGIAIEYQLADNNRKMSQEYPDRRNGAAYGLYPPTEDASKPVGEWNESRIRAEGNHVQHWLNAVKVADFEVGSADWKERLAASKFKEPAFGLSPRGRIVLQDHGQAIWFRSVRLREIGRGAIPISVMQRK